MVSLAEERSQAERGIVHFRECLLDYWEAEPSGVKGHKDIIVTS